MHRLADDQLIGLYTMMVRIRMVEENLMRVFAGGRIPGFLHVCIGQEATPAAVCSQLKADDYIGSTHRGHGHVLAKGIALKPFMAELFGKRDGFCMGRSGSMHLADPSLGILGANGIVGAGIPIATGAALAAKHKFPGRVSVCFFGDGATDQGTFHESLNMASLWRLPIVYVCENNGWAEFTPRQIHMKVERISQKVAAFDMPAVTVDNDVLQIYEQAHKALETARDGGGPTLLEVRCSRWHGHFVGDQQKYRDKKDLELAQGDDCLARFREQLLSSQVLSPAKLEAIAKDIDTEIQEALAFAEHSPNPAFSELSTGLYV